MPRLTQDTLQGIARELLGVDMSFANVEEVLDQAIAWQKRFARLSELPLDGVEPAFLEEPERGE